MRTIIFAVLIVELCAASAAAQTQATLVPSVSISTLQDDNVFATPAGFTEILTSVRPSLEGRVQSPTFDLNGLVSMDAQRSVHSPALNTIDARRQAMFDGHVRSTPSLLLGFGARYDRTETPSDDLNLDNGVLLARQRASRVQLTPSLNYRVTNKTTFTSQYDYTDEVLSGLIGTTLQAARVGIARRTSELTTWNAQYLGRMIVDDESQHHRSDAVLLGWNKELAPGTNLSLQGGPRYTSRGVMTSEVLAAFLRRTPRARFLVDYWHGETIILGIRGPVEIQSGSMKFGWAVRRGFDLGPAVAIFRSTTLDERQALVYHGSIVAAWMHEPYIFSVSYGTDLQQGDIRKVVASDDLVRRGVFSVRLTVAPSLSRAFRRPDDPDRPSTPLKGVLQ